MTYDLESVKLPRLAGFLFKLLTWALESPILRPLVIGTFLENSGVYKLRGQVLKEPPTVFVHWPAAQDEPGSPPDITVMPSTPAYEADGFARSTVWDYAHAYREGTADPRDVAQRFLSAIDHGETLTPPMRAFISVNQENVLAQAEASSKRLSEGKPLSIFDGVPVAVKDEFDMLPYGTTVGTTFLGKQPVSADATMVARLRAAGAVLVGKANMHEIGITPTGLNPHYGTPVNPYKPGHFPGGSSSGPAVAVSSGLCPVALGADGGGSIRVPASFCGIVGLKATYGRISEHGAAPLTWTMGHNGPLTASAEDAALAYAVIAGPDSLDEHTLYQPPVSIDGYASTDLTGIRMGVFRPWFEHSTPEVIKACEAAVERFTEFGAEIHEIAIPELDNARIAHSVTILAEMAANMEHYYARHHADYDLNTRVLLSIARQLTGFDYLQSQRIRTQFLNSMTKVFETVDVIMTPSVALTAPAIPADAWKDGESDTSTTIEIMRYAYPANLVGLPAISFNVGFDQSGLPIGLQVMGKAWQEHTLLQMAFVAEQFVERRKPQVYYDPLSAG